MTDIRPFKALIYNQEKVGDLARVVCPPYDVISPDQQRSYMDSCPYNLIHVLLNKEAPGEDKYKNAARHFKDWIDKEVLIQEKNPSIYFYSQQYSLNREKKERLGFIALLRLHEHDKNVFGHEHTRVEPKEDRLKLIRKVKANLSPIFVIFPDSKRIIRRTYQGYIKDKKPFIDLTDSEKVAHKLWRVDSETLISDIRDKMTGENIFIADGHHRYEVACAFREEMRKALGSLTGEEDFNYVLAYFTNTDASGLTIMPIHRVVKLRPGFDMDTFLQRLQDCFVIEEIKDRVKFFFLMQKAGTTEHAIGIYRKKRFWLLRLKNVKILDKLISEKEKEYRSLDVSILNYIILKNGLGLDIEDKERIAFSHDAEEVISMTDRESDAVAFLLNPAKLEQVMAVALKGEKMPSKSTYFYPKVLSGLVINKFGEK